MLFLYRIQNDVLETASFNACEVQGSTLGDLASFLQSFLEVDALEAFSWRLRKSDPGFGYIWRDVGQEDFQNRLEGELIMVRLLRNESLKRSSDRLPERLIGQAPFESNSKLSGEGSKKRGQAEATTAIASSKTRTSKPSVSDSFDAVFDQPSQTVARQQPKATVISRTEHDIDDGLTAEERAQIRIKERERQEQLEMERKVQEARDADTAAQANADARALAWSQLRVKLEGWSGGEKNRKPLRALLSTLHTVLWDGVKWTTPGILVRPNEVRLSFRKAMLIVHPDKVSSSSPASVQVVAKYCFENLNAAYEKFEETELKTPPPS